jgi:hypothetical protein
MKAYKVLSVTSTGRLMSFNTNMADREGERFNDAKLEYKSGRVTKPVCKGSKLFVFKSLGSAKKLASRDAGCNQIWEVEVDSLTRLPSKKTIPLPRDSGDVSELWVNGNINFNLGWSKVPSGTYLCNKVKLIRRVR